jgi:ligand-binding sensor domain-containing protein/signal transduction histidine kinase/DNA-binding response OmpR family regulator
MIFFINKQKLTTIVLALMLLPVIYSYSQVSPSFSNINTEQGLSNNGVTCILQDHDGFLWFGTWDGLNKYDGKKIIVYRPTHDLSKGLSNNNISFLFEDSDRWLWIGTKSNGLNRMNLLNGQIENLSNRQYGIDANWITCVMEDKHKNLWVSTENGIFMLDTISRTKNVIRFRPIITGVYITDIKQDKYNNLWFSSYNGLYYYSEKLRDLYCSTDYVKNLDVPLENLSSLEIDKHGIIWISSLNDGLIKATFNKDNSYNQNQSPELFANLSFAKINLDSYISADEFKGITKLFIDSKNNLWIDLWGKGLLLWKENFSRMEVYRHNVKSSSSLSNNYVLSVYEDQSGLIWVGSDDGGVNRINNNSNPFYRYTDEFGSDIGRLGPILETLDNKLYVGTRDAGLFFSDFNASTFKTSPELKFNRFSISRTNIHAVSYREITAVFEDSKQNLWIGTIVGLNCIPKTERKSSTPIILKYFNDPNNKLSLSDNNVTDITEDRNGSLWVGTMAGGLNRLDSLDKSGKPYFTRFDAGKNNKSKVSHLRIRTLFVDKENNLWVGTDDGLDRVTKNIKNGPVEFQAIHCEDTENGLSNNSIICINEAYNGDLWIGTTNGLSILKNEDKYQAKPSFYSFYMKDGLPNSFILSIQFDNDQQAWVTTNGGLVKINPIKKIFNQYNKSDGFLGSTFSEKSGFKDLQGLLFFGDLHGLNIFDPKEISQSDFIPQVKIVSYYTGAPASDNLLNPGLENSLTNKDILKLTYLERNFSIEFISFSYISPEKNQYQYKLEGFDRNWINSGTRNIANYTNIPPGAYTFKVRGSNGNGVWNPTEAKIIIKISSPWWFSWYAFVIYSLFVLLLVYSLFRISRLQMKLKHKTLIDKLEMEKIEGVNKAKLDFFTNISHDFRTPLTLILISLNQLKEKAGLHWEKLKPVEMAEKNVNILLRLVNQIMDIRKIENRMMAANPGKYDYIAFAKHIYEALIPLSDEKQIHYSFNTTIENIELYFDYSMMEKVYWNILSNAFKYTQIGGKIEISITKIAIHPDNTGTSIQVDIKDNGPGIPKNELPKIFDRFFQSGSKDFGRNRGTGLGLSIAKEMIELNFGEIFVESVENKVTCFSILLPVENPGLEKLSVQHDTINDTSFDSNIYLADSKTNVLQVDIESNKDFKNKPLLLIVEDNEDLRMILKKSFSPDYNIELAEDGIEGLEIALEIMPDIIVSDIVMPRMDGLKLCEKLKNDIKTSHIPLILLTAKTSVEHQLEGLNTNADDYITKPFNLSILDARIKNLIRERKYLKEKFKNAVDIDSKQLELSSIDQRFIDKAINIIEKNLSEVDFSVDDFARELGMSRSSMYRKIFALTGQSAKEFIRDFRIKKAAKLLKNGEFNVSEVAFEVGFISRSYFTKCFTEYFKMLPSKYAQTKGKSTDVED